jgi:glycogen debranching enzyme
MSEIIHVGDQYYILATSPFISERTRVLKHGDTFALFDPYGDVVPIGLGEQGIYHQGTRFLSRLGLRLEGRRPLLLSSTVIETNDLLAVDLTNADLCASEQEGDDVRACGAGASDLVLPHGSIHLFRAKFVLGGVVYERIRVTNHAGRPTEVDLGLEFEADYADIFEVRGTRRAHRGEMLEPEVGDATVLLAYRGLDDVVRRTRIELSPGHTSLSAREACYRIELQPSIPREVYFTLSCEIEESRPKAQTFQVAFQQNERALDAEKAKSCRVISSNHQFNDWLDRSAADLFMLVSETPQGPYPYAGVPWFSTAFGRDGIITALEWLWSYPALARGVLAYLAATQATDFDPESDAEPGKILHEARGGEMAALGEIPFRRYYGTVDATPLFVMLAGAYYERTADQAFIESLLPRIEAALAWIDQHGDEDGDGFVEYARKRGSGLANQGWKDSQDSVFHADGALAEAPIALAEVQGYVYAAKTRAASLARVLGHVALAGRLEEESERLRAAFDRHFFCEDLGTYAIALDRDKRPCRVRASNAGHCLYTGIALPERAGEVARTLLDPASYSGWGVRTIAAGEARYNPMSYHNGSIWPHDNALLAEGLSRYGLKDAAQTVATGLFDASNFVELHRMPELFCGFMRRRGEGPTLYPVACSPQAWAAGTSFLLIQSLLGMHIDAPAARITFRYPVLPTWLRWLELEGLTVAGRTVDLRAERHANDVSVQVIGRREAKVEVVVIK